MWSDWCIPKRTSTFICLRSHWRISLTHSHLHLNYIHPIIGPAPSDDLLPYRCINYLLRHAIQPFIHPTRNKNRPQSLLSEPRTKHLLRCNLLTVHSANSSLGAIDNLLLLCFLRLWHFFWNEIYWTIDKEGWTAERRNQQILARKRSYETIDVWMISVWSFKSR